MWSLPRHKVHWSRWELPQTHLPILILLCQPALLEVQQIRLQGRTEAVRVATSSPGIGNRVTKPSTAIKGTSSSAAGSLHCVGAKCLLQGGTGICCMIYVGCLLPSSCDFLLLHQNYNGRRSKELATLHAFLSLCYPPQKKDLQFYAQTQHQAEFPCSGSGNTGNPSTVPQKQHLLLPAASKESTEQCGITPSSTRKDAGNLSH